MRAALATRHVQLAAAPVLAAPPVLAAVVALVALVALACSEARPRNVLLISVDTLRADHLGAYGYAAPTSPFLDSLAARGVRFVEAHATASWTLPSHMSLMTSLHPHAHRVDTERAGLAPEVRTLAQVLGAAGLRTAAFVSWVYVSRKYGFDRGFDRFVELLPPKERRRPGSPDTVEADAFVDEVLEWAAFAGSEPFFLFLHLFGPHLDYAPPLEDARIFDPGLSDLRAGRYSELRPYIRGLGAGAKRIAADERARALALYDGEIRFVDRELARLFAALEARGLLEHTLVVFTSDHGEEFDEHGSMEGHGWTLYDEVTHVPLLLRFPDDRYAGTVVGEPVSGVDVAPTILDALGLAVPGAFAGRSLLPLVRGESVASRPVFSQIRRFNRKWAVRTDRHKLVYTADTGTNAFGVPVRPGYELYDLAADPGERRDRYAESGPEALALVRALDAFRAARAREPAPPAAPLSAEERRRLRALGYLDGAPPLSGSPRSAPDPPQ
ncbi:MAG: sulfatase [Myxococcota bacterium]|nr:sulfatase [Myxococcota bacterium]